MLSLGKARHVSVRGQKEPAWIAGGEYWIRAAMAQVGDKVLQALRGLRYCIMA